MAALTLTLTRNSSKMSDNLTSEQAGVLAENLLRDLNQIGNAVQRMTSLNGCSESEISFDNTVVTSTYVNSTSPSDKRCHAFDPKGGGLVYKPIPTGAQSKDSAFSGASVGWIFAGNVSVSGVGPENALEDVCTTKCAELIAYQVGFTEQVCSEFNRLVKPSLIAIPKDTDDVAPVAFTGTYGDGNTGSTTINIGSGDYTTALYGVKTACVEIGSATPRKFAIYSALIPR